MNRFVRRAFVVLAAAGLAACSTKKYIRPTTADVVERTEARIARGEYLVNSAGACGACHTGRKAEGFEAFLKEGESTELYLAGGNVLTHPMFKGHLTLPNLTPDPETGIGAWSDDEVIRAIRDGIGRDGRLLFPMMPFGSYQHMSDEDVKSIVAYLRTVPPVKTRKNDTEIKGMIGFMVRRGLTHHEPARSVPQPDRRDPIAWGRYVAHLGHCAECHSMAGTGPRKETHKLYMAGGMKDEVPGVGTVYMRNLTPDVETGLGKYDAAQIKNAIRTGRRLDGKKMAPPMSLFISHWSGMTDEDLDALVAWLKSLPAAKNKVPERELTPEWEKALAGDSVAAGS